MATDTLVKTTAPGAANSPMGMSNEPIPGYVLEECIGSGGYGEVWRAEAPGGLKKAIKLVYGMMDERRAKAELKSLGRIREVHHPFLLNIERVELVEGRLAIVTELADSCLMRRFNACQEAGLPGIPRSELIQYMRETADVLDFMYEKFSLQHLDVKPDNLLLLSGHVKVADFGLVKDLRESQGSVMSGLTPMFAGPEVFEGRPGRYSDQYALAVVYQYLLTGEPPFGGRTAAQLTAQHLHSAPVLTPLPASDRPIISRALAKDANRRFTRCTEMVEQLLKRSDSRTDAEADRDDGDIKRTTPRASKRRRSEGQSGAGADRAYRRTKPVDVAPKMLPPPVLAAKDLSYRPTVFIGVGGLAGRVLCELRKQFVRRFGPEVELPAFGMLLLDTDAAAVSEAMRGDAEARLRQSETLTAPLREAKDYRIQAPDLLEWLGRRWLYNVPRSRQTEGIRALGRLALIDHAEIVQNKIRSAISQAGTADAVAQTRTESSLPFQQKSPRVYLVGSTTGGTGGGCLLDMAYLTRAALEQCGCTDAEVCGLLVHCTGRASHSQSLGTANTIACLDELAHFNRPGSRFAVHAGLELSETVAAKRPFTHTYIVDLGEGIDDAEFERGVGSVASYLFHNTATPSSLFFDALRRSDANAADARSSEAFARTFGISVSADVRAGGRSILTDVLCRAVVGSWIEGDAATDYERGVTIASADHAQESARAVDALMNDLRLDTDAVLEGAAAVVQGEPGMKVAEYWRETLKGVSRDAIAGPDAAGQISRLIDDELTPRSGAAASNSPAREVAATVQKQLRTAAESIARVLRERMTHVFEDQRQGLTGAKRLLDGAAARVANSEQELRSVLGVVSSDVAGTFEQLERALAERDASSSTARRAALLTSYANLRFCERVHEWFGNLLMYAKKCIAKLTRELNAIRSRLEYVEGKFRRSRPGRRQTDRPATIADADGAHCMHQRVAGLLPMMRNLVSERIPGVSESLWKTASSDQQTLDRLVAALRNAAVDAIRTTETDGSVDASDRPGSGDVLGGALEAANPRLDRVGGRTSRLIALPVEARGTELENDVKERAAGAAAAIFHSDPALTACCETQDVPMGNILSRLVGDNRGAFELAAQLHTRVDVDWQPIDV